MKFFKQFWVQLIQFQKLNFILHFLQLHKQFSIQHISIKYSNQTSVNFLTYFYTINTT